MNLKAGSPPPEPANDRGGSGVVAMMGGGEGAIETTYMIRAGRG
jgi:hypothetical protein